MDFSTKVFNMALAASVITFSMVGTSEAIDSVPLPSKPRWGSVAIDTVPLPGKTAPTSFGKNRNLPGGDPRVMSTTLPVPDRKFKTPSRGGFGTPTTLPTYKVGRTMKRGVIRR